MASPRTRSDKRPDPKRNARLADWIARERTAYLRAVARRTGAPSWQTEDVVQAALYDFVRAFPGPDRREAALAYCSACVSSQAYKARRRYARKESRETALPEREAGDLIGSRREIELEDREAPDLAELAMRRERIAELRARLAELPEDQHAVVILAAAGYGTAEIAARRGLTERQVRKRIERANRRLRERG